MQKSYSKVSNLISRNSEGPIVPLKAYENKDFENFIETKVWTKLLIEMTRYEKIRTQSLDQLESIHLLRFATGLSQCLMRIIQSGSLTYKYLQNKVPNSCPKSVLRVLYLPKNEYIGSDSGSLRI